jgi:hypothetical protein
MLRITCWPLTLLLLPVLGLAQTQPLPTDATPSKQQVMQFLEVTQARARVVQLLDGVKKQGRLGAEIGFKQKVPDATPEELARVDASADSMFEAFSADEMIDAIVPIYQKHLTKSDIDAILAFYATPAGQRLLKETPAILAESMEVGGEMGRKKIATINERIEQQMKQMIEEEQAKRTKQQVRQPAKD